MRNIAEVEIAKQVIEVVSRYLSEKVNVIRMLIVGFKVPLGWTS